MTKITCTKCKEEWFDNDHVCNTELVRHLRMELLKYTGIPHPTLPNLTFEVILNETNPKI